jgi:hypothetical protein
MGGASDRLRGEPAAQDTEAEVRVEVEIDTRLTARRCRFGHRSFVVPMNGGHSVAGSSEEAQMGAAHVIHVEVVGKDGPALQSFYSNVFGWKLDTNNPGGYGMFRAPDGEGVGGGIGAAQDGGPGHVTFYVHADDPQGTLDRVEAAGGRVLMPLTEIAPQTTIALFADPEGHVVGLM